jgi:hypothetical protein
MPEHCIYCAGPLFNPSERAEMEMLAETLEQAGFKTFLPHRTLSNWHRCQSPYDRRSTAASASSTAIAQGIQDGCYGPSSRSSMNLQTPAGVPGNGHASKPSLSISTLAPPLSASRA